MLTSLELNIASSLLNILRPLEAATKETSGDKYCTGSKVIPLVRCMICKLKTFTTDEPLVMEVQKLVPKEINKQMGAIEQVSSLAIATILDRRFKKLHFEDPLNFGGQLSTIIKTFFQSFSSFDSTTQQNSRKASQ
ncbi:unnamed protein product [Euphydryas editha]|uniref:Uncharacterized protein n=1 Tax=Euphydryas editha TaxID=104508 RepID=A0AAU9V9L5_EUPED|nr:unnamed protein product [Euphydryas editha]